MNTTTKRIAAAVTIGAVAIGTFAYFSADPVPDCDRGAVNLSRDAPLELAAMLDRNCAVGFIGDSDDPRDLALNMGYLSILKDYASKTEMRELMDGIANYGERGGIQGDPVFLEYAEAIGGNEAFLDFAIASLAPERITQSGDIVARLGYMPIWNDPKNTERLISLCNQAACDSQTICDSQVGLTDKLSLAKGEITQASLVSRCEPTREWVMALRRAGVVDTSCSGTLQMNAPRALTMGCFPNGVQIGDYDSFTPGDSIAFLRSWNARQRTETISAQSSDFMAFQFPHAASYLKRNLD